MCSEFNETAFCLCTGIILCFFLSGNHGLSPFLFSLPHLVEATLLTASLVSCSYAYLGASFKHHLKTLISLPITMLFLHAVLSQVPFHKPVPLLSRNYWFGEPGLRHFMERGQAKQLRRNRPIQTQHVWLPQEEMHPITANSWNSQANFIYISSLVWVHCWPKRWLKRIVFVLSYHPSWWTRL